MTHAIIGAGHVGKAIARAFARKGIMVTLASRRSPEELAPVAKSIGPEVSVKSVQDALDSDVVVLAIPFRTYKEIAGAAKTWQGKIVIDATNAYGVSPEELGNRASSAVIAEALPGAGLVKAFNHLPAEVLDQEPSVGGDRRVLFLSGDQDDAIAKVAELVGQLGFAPVSLGKLDEGGRLIQAHGNRWAPLIFQDLFKKGE